MPRRLTFALAVIVLGWAALAWVHLYRFSVPWADTWCYLGPAAAAPSPLHLISPYLGTFHHSDQVWGLHFPAGPLIYSVVLGGFHFTPIVGVLLFLFLWAALAGATGLLVARLSGRTLLGALAGVAVLGEHGWFDVAQAARPELIAALIVLLLWATLCERLAWTEPRRLAALGAAEFLCPLVHPVTLAVGAAVAAALVLACFVPSPTARSRAATAGVAYLAGLAVLAAWFLLPAGAWEQFRDHASSRATGFGFGSHLWFALHYLYSPVYSGHLVWLAGTLFAVNGLVSFLRSRPPAAAELAWGGLILITVLVAQEKFRNVFYLLVGFPPCIALVIMGAVSLAERQRSLARNRAIVAGLSVLIALDGAFWVSRSAKYLAAGRPNFRAELAHVSRQLGAHPHLLIPEVLWESFLSERAAGVNLNTLPQWASPAYRRDYETLAFSALAPGDLVVVDRFQAFPPITDLRSDAWKPVAHWAHVLPGREDWGYDLTVYQKK